MKNKAKMNSERVALITGADGFIGSRLVELLARRGYKIRALSQYNSFNNWGWLEDIECKGDVEILAGDIRDPHYCKDITKDVDIIFHLAALIAIPYSYVAPDSYVDTNIKGTLNIIWIADVRNNGGCTPYPASNEGSKVEHHQRSLTEFRDFCDV